MNTLQAFANAQAASGNDIKVFDWDKAARLIKERNPKEASAGLGTDWEYTGGAIYKNGEIVEDEYTYLASNWATPELDMDGDICDCYVMRSEKPEWDSDTKWPDSAKEILNAI